MRTGVLGWKTTGVLVLISDDDTFRGMSDTTVPTKLRRQPSLSEQVVADLENRIVNGNMTPGDVLPTERELCEAYGVSRTVVREATRILVGKGILESISGRGFVVAQMSVDDISAALRMFMRRGTRLKYADLHEVRLALETAAVERTSIVAGNDARELITLCDDLAKLGSDEIVAASKNDIIFHLRIAELSQNDFFIMLFQALQEALTETRVATFTMDPTRIQTVAAAHRKVAEAIVAGDGTAAGDAMREHLLEVKATWDAHPEYFRDDNKHS